MKKFNTVLIGLLATFCIQAQQQNARLIISVTGNKNLQVTVDDRNYTPESGNIAGNKSTVLIPDLANGQHNVQVSRTNLNTNRAERISTPFILRARYDLQVNVNEDGSLELIETRKGSLADEQVPMTNTNFGNLLRSVKMQRTNTAKMSTTSNALTNPGNYFTTYQVRQLVQLFVAENDRLQLLKQSFPKITDQNNFYQLYNLLRNTGSTRELEDYVSAYYDDSETEKPAAMSDADFNTLYQSVRQQWPASAQLNAISNAFDNSNHYFTAYQASRLIQLISGESNRLQLAKSSYRSITDRENFSQVINLLSYQSSKDELADYINTYQEDTTTGMPMPDADFNSLYQDIRNQWPVSSQVNALTNAFNNNQHRFTANQASRLIQLVTGDNNRLPLAKLSYRSITDRTNFSQVINLLNYQSSKDELTAYINNYNNDPVTGQPMPDADFNTLYQDIRNEWPVSAQVNALTAAFNNNDYRFTAYQAGRLIQLVTGDNNRLPLAKLSYRSVTDRNNFSQVINLLGSQAAKNELTTYVNNYDGGTTARAAMPDAEFNALYKDVQMQFLPGAKMSALTAIFNNTSYYFSSAQAKQLVSMVSLESNRLQLAKLSYRSITDRNNFSQLYEVLGSQSSKDELDAYIKAYRE